MEIRFWLIALLTVIYIYMGTEKTNGYKKVKEDQYIPRNYKLSDKIFYRVTKQKYLRCREYWIQRIALIHFMVYTVILLISYGVTTVLNIEYSIGYKKFLISYYFMLAFTPLLIDAGMWIYIRKKKKDFRNSQ